MKKTILFLSLIFSLLGCSKKLDQNITPTIPSLPNTTWKGYITTATTYTGGKDSLFEFVQFVGSTQASITVGNSLIDPNKSSGTYPCVIKVDPKDAKSELFIISYTNGKIDTGFTVDYTNHISYNGYFLSQVN